MLICTRTNLPPTACHVPEAKPSSAYLPLGTRWRWAVVVLLGLCLPWTSTTAALELPQPTAELIPFQDDNGRWGYLDAESHVVVIEPRFGRAEPFDDKLGKVAWANPRNRGGRSAPWLYNYVRADGTLVFDQPFADIYDVFTVDDKRLPDLRRVSLPNNKQGVLSVATSDWVIPLAWPRDGSGRRFRFFFPAAISGRWRIPGGAWRSV